MKKIIHLLVAESDLQTLYLLEKILSETRFEFDLVCNPTEVWEILDENNYDLLILASIGCVNEKIKASDLVKKISEKKIPTLLLLENYHDNSQMVGLENCDYLAKPFGKKSLLTKIKGLLKRKTRKTRLHQTR